MTEIKSGNGTVGRIHIADEVIAIIAGTAAVEVDGVAGASGNFSGELAGMLGKKNLAKGVRIEVEEDQVYIEISIMVKFGYKLKEVSEEVQKRVKTAIETMTGMEAAEINVNVAGVTFEKANTSSSNEEAL